MDNFTFCSPTRYVFGRGVESQVGQLTAGLPARHVLIVSGGHSARRSGLLDRAEASLKEAGVSYVNLEGVQPNPTDDRVYEGIDLCRREKVDGIVAVGGGSVIDTAKGIAAGVPYSGDFWDFYTGKKQVDAEVGSRVLPIGVVLTIPAAGSEGSGNSVITHRSDLRKISIRTQSLRPRFALLDPELTYTLPAYQTAAGIADMMAHIMERYFTNTKGVETTDRLCEGLLMAIMTEAPRVMQNPEDYDARANIMWAGTLAHNGLCGCGRQEDWTSHGLEHELSALYGVTHGAGLAVVFPAWMTFMAGQHPAKIAQLGRRIFNVDAAISDNDAALETAQSLRSFFSSIGLPTTLAQLGIERPDFDTLVRQFHINKGNPAGFYRPITPEETLTIYHQMV